MNIKQIEAFFFRAMIEGWASSAEKVRIDGMPGYKGVEFKEGGLRLLDFWCTTLHSNKSAGTTTIWFHGVPLWFMSYGGYYEEEAIPVVKEALRRAYKTRRFVGGRGLNLDDLGGYSYQNNPRRNRRGFLSFAGREQVISTGTGRLLGFHEYWGMSLLE